LVLQLEERRIGEHPARDLKQAAGLIESDPEGGCDVLIHVSLPFARLEFAVLEQRVRE
jgi:hypothetical protein